MIRAGVPAHVAGQAANRGNIQNAIKASNGATRAAHSGIKSAASLSNITTNKRPGKVATRTINKDNAIKGAIAQGVDPGVAGSLGNVKKIPNVQKKAKAITAIAKAGGDAATQAAVGSKKKPNQYAQKITPGVQAAKQYNDQVKKIKEYNAAAAQTPKRTFVGQGGAFNRDNELKRRKKKKGARYSSSKGTASLRVPRNTGSLDKEEEELTRNVFRKDTKKLKCQHRLQCRCCHHYHNYKHRLHQQLLHLYLNQSVCVTMLVISLLSNLERRRVHEVLIVSVSH